MKKLKKIFLILLILFLIPLFWINPPVLFTPSPETEISVDIDLLKKHTEKLVYTSPPRNSQNITSLNSISSYIEEYFNEYCEDISLQKFFVQGEEYQNVICSFGLEHEERMIIGAHYDVHGNLPGADDNASAVAGLLELVRLMGIQQSELSHRVDFVAYTLEEMPNFRTETMGSMVHAKSLREEGIDIKLMISLEMIGYFSDEPNSQKFPIEAMKTVYSSTGNFIAVIGEMKQSPFITGRVKKLMSGASSLPVESINAPRELVPDVERSDHSSFWDYNYPAIMITDTSYLRNPNYHKTTDTIDTLDFEKMGEVVKGVYAVVVGY